MKLVACDVGSVVAEKNPLASILLDGIRSAVTSPGNKLRKEDYTPEYHKLIEDQNQIGWIHLFRCRWGVEWRKQYAQWIRPYTTENPDQVAQQWVKSKGGIILRQWWKLWKTRNAERHGLDQERGQKNLEHVVRSRLEELYAKRLKVMAVDRTVFPFRSAAEHLESGQSLTALYDWCLDNGPALNASCNQAETMGVSGTGNIQLYFSQETSQPNSATNDHASSSGRSC